MFTRPIRGWVIFAQILGTILSVVGLIAFTVEWEPVRDSLVNDGGLEYATTTTVMALILGILCYIIIKSVINMAVIIHACETMTDQELSANRWIISSLSLSVGGFFTPFVMKMFPNVNIQSTIKPKAYLAKVYGWTLALGAAAFMIVFGAVAQDSLGVSGTPVRLTEAFFIINGIFFILGIVLIALFTRKDVNTAYDNNMAMKVFANIIAGVVTAELVIMLIWNWIEVLGSLSEAFNGNGRNNPAMIFFAMINFVIGLIYVGFLTQITCETISGIWKNQATYTVFEPLQNRQSNTSNVTL